MRSREAVVSCLRELDRYSSGPRRGNTGHRGVRAAISSRAAAAVARLARSPRRYRLKANPDRRERVAALSSAFLTNRSVGLTYDPLHERSLFSSLLLKSFGDPLITGPAEQPMRTDEGRPLSSTRESPFPLLQEF